jgi:hypothetical protein
VDGSDLIRLYNCNDNAARTNFGVACEVPGSVEAITRIETINYDISLAAYGGLFLSRMLVPLGKFLGRFTEFFGELQGTVDASSSGGQYQTKTNVTTAAQSFTALSMNLNHLDVLPGQEIAMLCRLEDPGEANLQIRFYYQIGSDATFYSAWKTIESDTTFLNRLTSFLGFKDVRRAIGSIVLTGMAPGSGFYLQAKRSTGTADLHGDYFQIVTKPTLRIFSTSPGTYPINRLLYDSKGHEVIAINSTDKLTTDLVSLEGSDPFELVPGYENYIIYANGDIRRKNLGETAYDDTLSFAEVKVTPRWRVL